MIEIAEAYAISHQLDQLIKGKKIASVVVFNRPHKFCWLNHETDIYQEKLKQNIIKSVRSFAHFIVIEFDSGDELVCSEDVNFSFYTKSLSSDNHQMLFQFEDESQLELKVKLYGFILLGQHEELLNENPYYKIACHTIPVDSDQFTYEYFEHATELHLNKGSIKQALATKQHIPGLGNGTLQDILWDAMISPKRKVSTLSQDDRMKLYQSVKHIIKKMMDQGGRDQVLNTLGKSGGYQTLMHTKRDFCPRCQSELKKEAYLGGKVIYCPHCQT